MTLFGHTLEIWQILLLAYVLVYGLVYGIGNTMIRIKWVFTSLPILQSGSGKMLDVIWYVTIFVIVGYYW